MRLEVFHAADGDCLLLSSRDGHHVLVDGGRAGTFADNTQPRLQELRRAGESLDLVLVSHVDADHITGILRLLTDVGDWAVFDHQRGAGGNPNFPEPAAPRPPDIGALWHNSWRAQVDDLEGPIEALAHQVSEAKALDPERADSAPPPTQLALAEFSGLAESIADGAQLSRLIEERTPVLRNQGFPDRLALLRDRPHRKRIGGMTLTVIGPTKEHLETFRGEWRTWLEEQGVGLDGRTPASLAEAARIIEQVGAKHVTPPNRASITVLAEERGRTVLLTGDAAEVELIDGLEAIGKIGADGAGPPFHCTVLKVQHHGASHNLSRGFAERVVADHYVFSGDGAHGNPEPDVITTITETRPVDAGPYTLWFTSSEQRPTTARRREAMAAALDEARDAATRHPDLTVRVLADGKGSLVIDV